MISDIAHRVIHMISVVLYVVSVVVMTIAATVFSAELLGVADTNTVTYGELLCIIGVCIGSYSTMQAYDIYHKIPKQDRCDILDYLKRKLR